MDTTTDITNTIARWFAAVDRHDWQAAERLMTADFDLDYSSFGGGPAATCKSGDVLAGWATRLPGFDATHHQFGNLDVEQNGQTADMHSYVTATHFIESEKDGPLWTVVGTYDLSMIRDGNAWLLSGCRFNFRYQEGNAALPELATQRVRELARERSAGANAGAVGHRQA